MSDSVLNHDEALFVEGAQSYLEATTALVHYQQQVQKTCRGVMEGYIDEYALALGVSLDKNEITGVAYPKVKAWDGNWASLGIQIARRAIVPGVRWWETYCFLTWQSKEPGFWCYVGEWFPTQSMASGVYQLFHGVNINVEQYENEVGIYANLEPNKATGAGVTLANLSQQWIAIWKHFGGMDKFFKQ